jgi:hypothetical protein
MTHFCQVAPYNVPGSCGNNAPLSCAIMTTQM